MTTTNEHKETTAGKSSRRLRAAAVITMVLALLLSVSFMQKFLCIPYNDDNIRIANIHKEPENSLDVLLIGSSATYSDFSSAYAYGKYGFTSFPYAIGGATCTMWKPALQDTLRYQKPKLVVVDVFGGGYENAEIRERNNQLSIALNYMPLSADKVRLAKELSGLVDKTSVSSFLLPIIKYHNNIPLSLKDLPERLKLEAAGPSPLKGTNSLTRTRKLAYVDESSMTSDSEPLDSETEAIIRDFIDYAGEQNVPLLFVKYPSVLTDNDPDELKVARKANRILEIAEESGCGTLDLHQKFHELGLKERKDFYNHGHTNTRGQKKVTDYLGDYIQNEMGVGPSELSDSQKAAWDESIAYYDAYYALSEELMKQGKRVSFGDEPALVRDIGRIVNGTDVSEVADEYESDS